MNINGLYITIISHIGKRIFHFFLFLWYWSGCCEMMLMQCSVSADVVELKGHLPQTRCALIHPWALIYDKPPLTGVWRNLMRYCRSSLYCWKSSHQSHCLLYYWSADVQNPPLFTSHTTAARYGSGEVSFRPQCRANVHMRLWKAEKLNCKTTEFAFPTLFFFIFCVLWSFTIRKSEKWICFFDILLFIAMSCALFPYEN